MYQQGGSAPIQGGGFYDSNLPQQVGGFTGQMDGQIGGQIGGSMGTMGVSQAPSMQAGGYSASSFDDEPPLLEELGINFEHIIEKTKAVLHPTKNIDSHIMDDTDLAGPLVFCLLLGFFLLFTGKIHFGVIYGVGGIGSVAVYAILNLMSEKGIDIYCTVSVLGYCLLPIVMLALLSIVLPLKGLFGLFFSGLAIAWACHAASTMFVSVLHMTNQRWLVAYPVGLLYTCFALITIF